MKPKPQKVGRLFQPCRNFRGTTTMEVGLLISLFLLVLFGIVEFGLYFLHQHTLQTATRDGIRIGLLGTKLTKTVDGKDGPKEVELTREASIRQAIKDKAVVVMTITDNQIKFHPFDAKPDKNDSIPDNAGEPGQVMQVQVDHDHQFITPLIGELISGRGNSTIPMQALGVYVNEVFTSED